MRELLLYTAHEFAYGDYVLFKVPSQYNLVTSAFVTVLQIVNKRT